jgi:hypothetical protein
MRRNLKLSFIAFAVFVAATAVPTHALASPITATYSMTLGLASGTDDLGLDGAHLTLSATFDFPQNYVDEFSYPAVPSTSNSLTISNASVSATNGGYTEPNGIHFFPTFDGQIWNGLGTIATYQVNGQQLYLAPSSDTVNVNIGDPFSASHFVSTFNLDAPWGSGTAQYSITAFDVTVTGGDLTAVPAPATLPLLAAGAVVAFIRKRRQTVS